jgi:hypothetical protein
MNINITKQQWTIIGVVVAIILVWYFFLRKKTVAKQESGMILGNFGIWLGKKRKKIKNINQ